MALIHHWPLKENGKDIIGSKDMTQQLRSTGEDVLFSGCAILKDKCKGLKGPDLLTPGKAYSLFIEMQLPEEQYMDGSTFMFGGIHALTRYRWGAIRYNPPTGLQELPDGIYFNETYNRFVGKFARLSIVNDNTQSVKIYVNETLVATKIVVSNGVDGYPVIGGLIRLKDPSTDIRLRNFRIYDSALSVEEIAAIPSGSVPCLIEKDGQILTFDREWFSLHAMPPEEEDFKDYGINIGSVPSEALQFDSPVKVLSLAKENLTLKKTFIVPPQLILAKGDISLSNVNQVEKISLKATESGSGVVRVIVSSDSGVTWKSWDGTGWIEVDHNILPEVKEKGLTIDGVNNLTSKEWSSLVAGSNTIRFGYYLEQDELSDVAEIDELSANLEMSGTWERCHPDNFHYRWKNDSLIVELKQPGSFKINYPVQKNNKS